MAIIIIIYCYMLMLIRSESNTAGRRSWILSFGLGYTNRLYSYGKPLNSNVPLIPMHYNVLYFCITLTFVQCIIFFAYGILFSIMRHEMQI
uniref:Uncharacterized protein n=1 Tax=Lactuca sativa TaxID=4236 RepID=A0A9R1X1D1_LACSA|nr:hypothetical protein LSAT_V11C700362180 [Lactuca sativa]